MIVCDLVTSAYQFSLIKTRKKNEDYLKLTRLNNYRYKCYLNRVYKPGRDVVIYRCRHTLNTDCIVLMFLGLVKRSGKYAQHTEWGEPVDKGSHLVLLLGHVIDKGRYRAMRAKYKVD